MSELNEPAEDTGSDIAVVGMACRFPGAPDVETFWANLRDGVESIRHFTPEELAELGVPPEVSGQPGFVPAGAPIDDPEGFDHRFWGYSPREAALLDPQQRLFLETAWAALEHAGHTTSDRSGTVGVYAGMGLSTYLLYNLLDHPDISDSDTQLAMLGNDKDFLSSRVSYHLDLRGPSMTVQTGCSTSLVAAHLACDSLLSYQCDLALVGGSTVVLPERTGYVHVPGGTASSDGRCRAFDAAGDGTVFGSGAGVLALKRLDDALEDGDTVYAVIKASAVNSDGANRVGFTAPSLDGQAEVVLRAQKIADVDPRTVTYVETHGTATKLGDPVEVAALTKAFRQGTDATGYCAIGSVKTNIGHLDAAAGAAGLIKTALALHHGKIPPSLNFDEPNPQIDFAASPFYVNTELVSWPDRDGPRRAGVSAFGFGGTNAHIVLEQAPALPPVPDDAGPQLLVLSARTPSALEETTARLARHLQERPDLTTRDVAHTLRQGRVPFEHRRALVVRDREDALAVLEGGDPTRLHEGAAARQDRPVAFMFAGLGDQYRGMGRDLYEGMPEFRTAVDECCDLLRPLLGLDLRDELRLRGPAVEAPASGGLDLRRMMFGGGEEDDPLQRTGLAHPALFVVEYALARLWQSLGVRPAALIGHSLGEYVAATVAGVFTLEDALSVVVARAKLFDEMPQGAMLAVPLGVEETTRHLDGDLAVALVNGPALTAVSGPVDEIEALERRLAGRRIAARRMRAERGFHSPMVAGMAAPLAEFIAGVPLAPPRIPLVSNVTGTWMTPEQATDPAYWARHSVSTVRFADGLATLCAERDRSLVEVGPGQSLSALAAEHLAGADPQARPVVVPSLRAVYDRRRPDDLSHLLDAIAQLWTTGAAVDWDALSDPAGHRRVGLPTYPFERTRCRFDPPGERSGPSRRPSGTARRDDPESWLLAPAWQSAPMPPPAPPRPAGEHWLLLAPVGQDGLPHPLALSVKDRATAAGHRVTVVVPGAPAPADGHRHGVDHRIDPADPGAYAELVAALDDDQWPAKVLHLWSVDPGGDDAEGIDPDGDPYTRGMHSLLWLSRALSARSAATPVDLWVVSHGLVGVERADRPRPEVATLLGAAKCVPQEYEGISVRCVDVAPEDIPGPGADELADRIIDVVAEAPDERLIAYRGRTRWVRTFQPLTLGTARSPLRGDGVYVITGGLGAVGLELADHLADMAASIVLTGRSAFPDEEEWDGWTARHGDDDPTSRRIRRLRAMRERGARVLVQRADVTDEAEMNRALAETERLLGPVTGVFHAAGIVGENAFAPIDTLDRRWLDGVMRAKVDGTRVLERTLAGREPEFVLLFSSNAALLGGLGTAGYTSACVFLDSFAQARAGRPGTRWISVDMEDWIPDEGLGRPMTSVTRYGVGVAEGVRLLSRIAESAEAGVTTIVTADLEERLDRWVRHPEVARRGRVPAGGARQPRPELSTAYTEPCDTTETVIADIWAEMLGVDKVGRDDDFYELGGHSLLATQIVSRARAALGVELSLLNLLRRPTVAGLADYVRGDESEAAAQDPIPVAPRDEALALSYGQQRFWIIDQLTPGNSVYNIPDVVRVEGPLDAEVLRSSLDDIVARHEALRTSFGLDGERPTQRIATDVSVPLPVTDLRDLPEGQRRRRWEELALAESRRPFDLTRAPLLRAALLRVGEEEHILLLTMHHSVSDAWSTGVFVRELGIHYAGRLGAATEEPPPLPVQYADYSAWQRARLDGPQREELVEYWRTQLADAPQLVEFPPDHPRPAAQSFAGATVPLTLPGPLVKGLQQLGGSQGATLFMTLLAAFTFLLHRYSGERDVVVGSPIAGRTHPDVENLIGVFVNMLALRTDVDPGLSFRDLLERVKETTLGAYAHQELPFELVVEAVAPERSLGHGQLFQNVLVLQNAPLPPLDLAGLHLEQVPMPAVNAKFDLMIMLRETGDEAVGILEYATDLFTEETVRRIGAHFVSLLNKVVADPDRPLARIDLLSETERARVTGEWAHGPEGHVGRRSLPEMFREHAAATPDTVAVRDALDPAASLTFEEVEAASNQLARELRRRGVGAESRVAVCAERSPETIVLLLAVMKAGAAYVPLDPAYPKDRLRFMLADSGAELVLVAGEHRERLGEGPHTARTVDVDALRQASADLPAAPLDLRIDPAQPAYVLYTSGSTGVPKGVIGLHGGMVNRLEWMWREFPFQPGEVLCQKTSLNFLDSFWEIFGPLCQGVPVVVLPQSLLMDLPALVAALAEHRVTRIVLVPSLLRALLDTVPDLAGELPALRLWVSSGEALPADLAGRFLKTLQGRTLLNLYGASEISADVTWHVLTDADVAAGKVPLGRPIAGTSAYLLDELMRPVPAGVAGDLYIGGPALGRGYVGRPDLTAERFVPNPFPDGPGGLLYRTGDRARFRSDGAIEYAGRSDQQAKVRGFRVEPAEVEQALLAHPALEQAVVTAEGEVLAAYYVAAEGQRADVEELRRHLHGRLPGYMVPTLFVPCAELPLTPSGKIDRRALSGLARTGARTATASSVAPRDDAERAVAVLWQETLGTTGPVGVHDDYWASGGYSLLATRFAVRVRETFGAAFPLDRFFADATVAGVVRTLRDDPDTGHEVDERAALLLRVAELSDSDLDRLLTQEDV
ncbi:amino acid adenylation domain-containing protein [Streptomyces luteogriseus]|uniref:type I polyketide synthase n=1 Tax=Streptomyces luteogriseus TaxID=68233 RepID=UPI00381A9CEC